MAHQVKSIYIQKDTNKKQNRVSEKANNSASPLEYNDIGKTSNYVKNEIKDYSDNPHQMEEEDLVKQEPNINANNFNEEDALNWDNSLLDFLRVESNEDKYNSMGIAYPVDYNCAVCTKVFQFNS